MDSLRSLCGERQEQGGRKCDGEGCFAHLIFSRGVVKAGPLQLRNRRNYSGGQHDAIDEMVG